MGIGDGGVLGGGGYDGSEAGGTESKSWFSVKTGGGGSFGHALRSGVLWGFLYGVRASEMGEADADDSSSRRSSFVW